MNSCVVVKIRFDFMSMYGVRLKYGSVMIMWCLSCLCVRCMLIVLCWLIEYGVGVRCGVFRYWLSVSLLCFVNGCVLFIR